MGLLGLSNNHVICEFNAFGQGTPIIQPGAGDGGTDTDVVAHVEDFVQLHVYNVNRPTSTVNTADVAWCKPAPGKNVSKVIGVSPVSPTGECDLDHEISTFGSSIDVRAYGKQSKWDAGQGGRYSSDDLDASEPLFAHSEVQISESDTAHAEHGGTRRLRGNRDAHE